MNKGVRVEKVKKLVRAGSSIPSAIKECLDGNVREFALRNGRPYTAIADVLNGKKWPHEGDIAALIAELGGTDQEWRELLHEAGRPVARAS